MLVTRAYWVIVGVFFIVAVTVFFLVFKNTESTVLEKDALSSVQATILLTDEGFVPRSIRITRGTTIVFSNETSNQFWPASNPHPTHTLYGAFDSKRPLASGETWSFVFDTPGVWRYHDHMRSYFTGVIYVE